MPALNSTITFVLGPLLDANSAAITGATWTAVSALKPDGTTFVPVYTDKLNGMYWATVTGDQIGMWALFSHTVSDSGHDDVSVVEVTAAIAGNVVMTTVPIAVNGTLSLMQSTDYAASETRSLDWTTTDAGTWPDLTTATVLFVAKPQSSVTRPGFSISGSVVTPSGATKHVRVEVPAAVTAAVSAGTYDYQVRATFTNTHVVPLASGTLDLTEFLT